MQVRSAGPLARARGRHSSGQTCGGNFKGRPGTTDRSAARYRSVGTAVGAHAESVMYIEFFGLRELPFNNTPDPRFFYSTPDHEEALASLIYAVKERKGFVLLTGEVGAGKTLVTRMMVRNFGTNIAFANINHAVDNADDLMASICTELEIPIEEGDGPTDMVRSLHDYLLAQFAQNIPVVLLLDEAQNLPADGFERLRMIGNLEADDAKLLQIAIVGQPELQQRFASPKLRQLGQRIFRSFHLPALSREATEGYILHRLSVVTDEPDKIFSAEAVDEIYRVSNGLPRVINTICDNTLLSAYSANRRDLDRAFVQSVTQHMTLVGTVDKVGSGPGSEARTPRPSAGRFHSAPSPARAPLAPTAPRSYAPPVAVDPLVSRLAAIESQLRCASLEAPRYAHVDAHEQFRAECAAMDRRHHAEMASVLRRVGQLEKRRQEDASTVAESGDARRELSTLVHQARTVISRATRESRVAEKKTKQLHDAAASVKGIVRGLSKLLEQTGRSVAEAKRAEQNAQTAYRKLVEQTRVSREVTERIARLTPEVTLAPQGAGDQVEVLKTGSASSVGVTPVRRDDSRTRSEAVGIIRDVHESSSGLRRLAQTAAESGSIDRGARRDATRRLAEQVDDLLHVAQSGAVSQSNSVSE